MFKEEKRATRLHPRKVALIKREEGAVHPYIYYFLFFILQKKCQVLKIGSQRASAGKYLTSLISRYTLWRLCPNCDFPKRFLSSCFPKFPASSTSFSTNLPYFSLRGTIRREAGMPNTSCMIYMIAPANFHNPNSFNSFCKEVNISQLTLNIEIR